MISPDASNNNTAHALSFWITKVTDTLRIYNTYCFCTTTMFARTCLSPVLYVYGLSCIYFELILTAVVKANRQKL